MKVLTLVIPAYNSEKFLDKGIPSMLVSELLAKLEIIIVNDGSRDATAEIAEKYCQQYPDTVHLISQENKGHGGALNTGCAAAQGKYVKVIDADDWILSENLLAYMEALENCDSDVVLTHYHTVDISTGEVRDWKSDPEEFGKSYTFEEIMADWHRFARSFTLHGITYRTDFYRQYGHRLLEHVFYEDYEYAAYPCAYAESITPMDVFLYEYRVGDVNQSVSDANQLKRIGHIEAVLQRMADEYQTLSEPSAKQYAATKIQELLLSYLTVALLVNPDRKNGRKISRQQMEKCRTDVPEAYTLAIKKYQIFCLMNRLHVSKATWEAILKSPVYKSLRKRSFG